jgi:hypothetical protein
MEFNLDDAIEILARTPATLKAMLAGLPEKWTTGTEGSETWSAYDVLGHLINGERTDWLPRASMILDHGDSKPFEPFDRFAQFDDSKGKSLAELLDEFDSLRRKRLDELRALNLKPADLEKPGMHPALGRVTLKELLATWVAHDLDHVGQIARVMAKQYTTEVGPWRAFLSILEDRRA